VKSVVLPIKPHPATAPRVPWCPPEVMAKHPRPQMPVHKPNYLLPKKQDEAIARQKKEAFNPYSQEPTFKASTAVDPVIGASFRGNEGKFITSPPDNAIAISDDGYIVSATNETVEYYDELGNRLQLINSLYDFVGDTSAGLIVGDPKVLYDPYFDRFIFSVLEGKTSSTSIIHLLFSRSGDPRDGWNRYELRGDTLQEGFWVDQPQIAISENELFVAGFMVHDSIPQRFSNKVWQLRKKEPMNGVPNLIMHIWSDIENNAGDTLIGLLPLSDGLGLAEEPGIWLAASEPLGGSQIHFFHIEDSIGGANQQLTSLSVPTSLYSQPLRASQLGTSDFLDIGDCRLKSGFILDSTIHYVFNGDIGGGYSGVIYNRIDIRTMVHHRNTWGLPPQFDYAYPAVASYGMSKFDHGVMITFLRSGSSIYPQHCVVNYDGQNWSPTGTRIVKNGESYSDVFPMDTVERWGDYIGIARKYNSPTRSIWMAGQYGVSMSSWGLGQGFNTWIAEVLDTAGTAIANPSHPSPVNSWKVFPNPASQQVVALVEMEREANISILILDLAGRPLIQKEHTVLLSGPNEVLLEIENLANGIYLLSLIIDNQPSGYEKVIIAH
jgi:hypothetical protein